MEDGYYKIGISKNPINRLKQLQTGNSSQLKLIESYYSDYANNIEKALQRRYSYLNKEGEWFDLSLTNEISFIDECERIEKSIIILKENNNLFI